MLKKRVCGMLLFSALILSLAVNFHGAYSQENPVIYVSPASVIGLNPPQNFTIQVIIANITDLYGIDIQFRWDPTILDYVKHTAKVPVEIYPDGVLYQPEFLIKDVVNATAGTYWLAHACMDPAPVFTGTGIAFNMTFHVKGQGHCVLEIYGSNLSNKGGNPIVHEVQNGYFNNYVPPTAKIHVDPGTIVNASLVPSNNFTVNINAENLANLQSFEFWLGYNTSILDALEVNVNPAFPPPVGIDIHESEGQIRVNATASTPVNGSLSLASILFHVAEVGESVLDLHSVTLIDSSSEALPYEEPGDGYFNNLLVARIYVDPPQIIDPTMKPGSQFHIDIKMENIIEFYSYEFNLGYDTHVITCLGIVIFPPDNDTSFTTEMVINDTIGQIRVNVTYHSPATPKSILSPATIATIYFQVESYGATTLDLHDTKITKETGEEISYVAEDGFFATITRDVEILHVETSTNMTYPGRIVNVTVLAHNLGDVAETFNVTAYYGNNTMGTKTVVNLQPNVNATLVFHWDTTGLQPCNNFSIKAVASQVPYELNLGNNVYVDGYVKIKMIGDVNGDGKIDIYDVTLAAVAYGAKEGDPNWNPEADVAPQWGIIDIYDIVTIASRYGSTCP
jgi:hypothetical protein